MSNPADYSFFKMEVEQRMHSIIGPQPLQGYLPQVPSQQEVICGSYDEQVQYFMVERNPFEREQVKQKIRSSINLLLGTTFSIQQVQEISNIQIPSCNILICLNLNQSQAILELFSFSIGEEYIVYQREWRKRMPKPIQGLIDALLIEAALYEFNGIKIQSILIANAGLRLQIQAQLIIFLIQLQFPLQANQIQSIYATINQAILDALQKSQISRQKRQSLAVKIEKLVSWKDVETNYSRLDWKKKVELTYRSHTECGLSLSKGRFAKFKSSVYLTDICYLVEEIITKRDQQLSIEIQSLIQKIVEEEDQQRIFTLFQELFKRVVQKNSLICVGEYNDVR